MTDGISKVKGPGRKLGLFAAIALVMGNMIGSGVFLLPASLAPFGWNAVIAWILTIGGAMVLAVVIARLTRQMPEVVGLNDFVGQAFGQIPAFLIGWIYLVAVWTGLVAIAVAGVSYLSSLLPVVAAGPFGPALSALVLLWAVTLVNLRGVHAAGSFQIVTVILKILPLVAVIVITVLVVGGGEVKLPPIEREAITVPAVSAAATLTLWALLGFECASVAAAQVEDPARNVPRATLWGTALTGVLYLVVCSAIALLLPADLVAASPAPFATFVEHFWSAGPAALVALFAVISCVGALNGWVLMAGELPRCMAQRGILPHWLAQTDGSGTPRRALLVSSAIASLFLIMNASRTMQGLFEFLLLLSTSATLWLYLAVALAAVRLRVAQILASIGAAYSLWTLWGAGIEASSWSLVLMFVGLPIFYWARRATRVA